MKPQKFNLSNGVLFGGPHEKYGTTRDVEDLPVWKDDNNIVSCWKPTWKERFSLIFFGKVWVHIKARNNHPPISLKMVNTYLIEN